MRLATPFCRVTVLAPHTRVDLAMPADVPVAELVPMLTERLVRLPANGPSHAHGPRLPEVWCLAGAAGSELPADATLGALGVLDGDLLRLRPRSAAPAPPVFDDPVDAVARADEHGRPPLAMRPWASHAAQRAALAVALLAAPGAAVSVAAARGTDAAPNPAAALVGGATAVLALWLAALAARRGGVAAAPLALAAVGLAAVTGWAAVPGEPGPAHLLVVVALGGITAAVALVMLRVGVALLVALIAASALAGVALAVATLLGGSSAGVAASAAAVALAVGPLLPRLSARLAGLPPPVIVADFRELLQADDRGVQQPEELFDRTGLTHDYLAGMVAAAAAVAAVGAVLAGLSGGWAGPLFAGVVVAVLLLRSRGYVSAAPVLTLLIAGTGVAAVIVAVAVVNAGSTGRLAAGVALLGVAAAAVVFGGAARQRPPSPVLRRAIDVLEALLVAVTFPLALAVLDLYRTIRGL